MRANASPPAQQEVVSEFKAETNGIYLVVKVTVEFCTASLPDLEGF